MKKIVKILGLLLICAFVLAGCSNEFINKNSKNVNEYNIKINIDCQQKTFNCEQVVNYVNKTGNELNEVVFNLYPNAFSNGAVNQPVSVLNEGKAFPNGKNYGTFNILNVKVEGQNVNIEYDGIDKSFLIIKLKEVLYNNENVKIEISFEGKLPNILHRYGYGDNTINFGNFYPIACVYENGEFIKHTYHSNGDPFYSDMANYYVNICYNEPYILATTGYVVDENVENGNKTTKIEAKAVRDFAFVLSNKFECATKNIGETTINYFYYDDENFEKSLQAAVDSISTFNKLFGEYPYSVLNVVKTNFVYGGMEYPNLIYISDSLENYEDYVNTIIHETAHQWWYGMVGNDEYRYGWLDEGLTEFSTALFYEENPYYNILYEDIMKNANASYSLFVQVYEEVFGEVDTSLNRSLNEYNTEPEYVYMAYVKGMLLFDNLRELIGEHKFNFALKNYFQLNKGKNVIPADLIDAFKKASGRELQGFFDSLIEGKTVIAKI